MSAVLDKVDRHGSLEVAGEADWSFIAFDKHLAGFGSVRGGLQGASANTFLLGAFLYHSRLKDSLDGNELDLPGGLACWKDVCEVLHVTLPSIMTMSELASRVLVLVDELAYDEAVHLAETDAAHPDRDHNHDPDHDHGRGYTAFMQALQAARKSKPAAAAAATPSSQSQSQSQSKQSPLSSCNLVGGALSFLHEYLTGSHTYLSAHQLCEAKTLVYDVCSRLRVNLSALPSGSSSSGAGAGAGKAKTASASTSTNAAAAAAAAAASAGLPGLADLRRDLARLRNTVTDIVSERSWIEAGCVPARRKLKHHKASPLSELSVSCAVAGPLRCLTAPFISQVCSQRFACSLSLSFYRSFSGLR